MLNIIDIPLFARISVPSRVICRDAYDAAMFTMFLHGDKFKIFTEDDFHILERREIDELYENGRIEWVERYEKKYRESNPDKGVS